MLTAIPFYLFGMDMSGSFESAVRLVLPNVDIVFGHFHVNALINKALDEIRRQQQNTLEHTPRKVIKGKRFLLLKNYSSLDKTAKDGCKPFLMLMLRFSWHIP